MKPSEKIIERFGGLSAMSAKMEKALGKPVPVSTIQYWAAAGYIPSKRQPEVMQAGRFHGIEVAPADFFEMREAS